MTKAEKTHLSHAHVTDLLKGMIRIRHFEDKCAELYTQQKIRGFLHLYDGEEAIAIGVISVLGDKRPHCRHLPRARPCAGPRRADARGHGRDVRQGRGLLRRPRRLHAPVPCAHAISSAATPLSAAACRLPEAWRLATSFRAPMASPSASSVKGPWPRANSTRP
jgi:TPP-dependent pyruvate/acetoin dehydrogenase alpha subunit